MRNIIFIIILFLITTACSTTRTVYVPVENQTMRTDTLRTLLERVDTVRERDSVTVMQRGDTVWLTRHSLREKVSLRRDTIYRALHDTIYRQTPVPVERSLTRWQRIKQDTGGLTLAILALLLLLILFRTLRRSKRLP